MKDCSVNSVSERIARIEARMEEQGRAGDLADREREKAARVTADAVAAALESSEKLNIQRVAAESEAREGLRREVQLITDASQRAIGKAEEAQKEVNVKSNEFRGQLADQAATLYPRAEAEVSQREVERRLRLLEGHDFRGEGAQRAKTAISASTITWIVAVATVAYVFIALLSSGILK